MHAKLFNSIKCFFHVTKEFNSIIYKCFKLKKQVTLSEQTPFTLPLIFGADSILLSSLFYLNIRIYIIQNILNEFSKSCLILRWWVLRWFINLKPEPTSLNLHHDLESKSIKGVQKKTSLGKI